ncbi:MAG: DUF6371 domain-containing protein [Patiriisocius sp.]|uniref:DUF6371 domain-containing protein n=1 Tax=Patiriisocius sp. TaxID=2822396 RepID=UPI003EF2E1E1
MKDYRYILEPYNGLKTRHTCPNCNKKYEFTRYIDNQTGDYINFNVGICNRLIKCGYHNKPKQYLDNNNSTKSTFRRTYIKTAKPKSNADISFINSEIMRKSISSNNLNYFIKYLASLWDLEIAYYLAEKYNIGTSKYWKGATVFWQVDVKNNIRSGKIMLYNPTTGNRVKEPFNHITWVHKVLQLKRFNLEQCLFGEHLLLEDMNKPVAIVESEKTAIIASIYLPEFIWLACGSLNNLNEARTRVLKGRDVVLFPDLNCYNLWNDKIPKLTPFANYRTSTLLRDNATESEKHKGLDLADYLIKI